MVTSYGAACAHRIDALVRRKANVAARKNRNEHVVRRSSEQTRPILVLRLYISGASPKSFEAISNIKRICDTYFSGQYQLDVVDIYQQPDSASRDRVLAVPMLVKSSPLPKQRVIGTLSNTRRVLRALDSGRMPMAIRGAAPERR